MNFDFTEEQIMIQQSARDYAQRELIKDVLERDAKAEFPAHHVKALAELGFLGMLVDTKYDGGWIQSPMCLPWRRFRKSTAPFR